MYEAPIDFTNYNYVKGYVSQRIKRNNDPIPPALPGTVEYRHWMAGWMKAKEELYELTKLGKVV